MAKMEENWWKTAENSVQHPKMAKMAEKQHVDGKTPNCGENLEEKLVEKRKRKDGKNEGKSAQKSAQKQQKNWWKKRRGKTAKKQCAF